MVKLHKIMRETLEKYINANHKLLGSLGVFIALTVFFSNIEIKLFAGILSLVSLSCSLIIWLELWGKFPNKEGSGKLMWFENILSIGILTFFVFWMYKISRFYPAALGFIIGFIILWFISIFIKRWNIFDILFRTTAGEKKSLRYFVGWSILFIVYLLSMFIGGYIAPFIDSKFDDLERENPSLSLRK